MKRRRMVTRSVTGKWLRFSAVGILGAGIQLAMLALMLHLRMNYLLATGLALETAVLHNYIWHRLWTWRGQPGSLWRFHVANGFASLLCNLALMRLFTGTLHFPPLPANLIAIALTSIVNFTLAPTWVFSAREPAGYDVKVPSGQ